MFKMSTKNTSRLGSLTCMNCEKKLMTATMQNKTQIPLICSLCSFTSLMAKVCEHTWFSGEAAQKCRQPIGVKLRRPHPEDLAEEHGVDGVDGAVDGSAQRAQQHVGPLGPVVLEDASDWGGFHMFSWFLLILIVHLSEVGRV